MFLSHVLISFFFPTPTEAAAAGEAEGDASGAGNTVGDTVDEVASTPAVEAVVDVAKDAAAAKAQAGPTPPTTAEGQLPDVFAASAPAVTAAAESSDPVPPPSIPAAETEAVTMPSDAAVPEAEGEAVAVDEAVAGAEVEVKVAVAVEGEEAGNAEPVSSSTDAGLDAAAAVVPEGGAASQPEM